MVYVDTLMLHIVWIRTYLYSLKNNNNNNHHHTKNVCVINAYLYIYRGISILEHFSRKEDNKHTYMLKIFFTYFYDYCFVVIWAYSFSARTNKFSCVFFQNLILTHLDLKKLEFWYKQVKSRVRLELCLPESNFPGVANFMMFKGRLLQTVSV